MIAFVLGTRPELVKAAPVIREAQIRGLPFKIIHTGQHYSQGLHEVFFRELEIPPPDVNLRVGSLPPVPQLARLFEGVGGALEALAIGLVVVQGDTNSMLAGALAAHKLRIPTAHVEAGLRSDDWTMPEEGNRVLAARIASIHFCPTEVQKRRLAAEGITRGVHVVGNTIVDACLGFLPVAERRSNVRARLRLEGTPYALLTMHRPSNVDDPERLRALLAALRTVARALGVKLVFPVHPRTGASIQRAGLEALIAAPDLVATEPVGYLDLLALLRHAEFVVTDSGGAQEEACILRVPCVTLRANTERPETVEVGANVLCPSVESSELLRAVREARARPRTWANPFGDGKAARRVMDVITASLGS
jgi:UDP-N-acetylglucosamine 2-epimerase (non-hydrolysing)